MIPEGKQTSRKSKGSAESSETVVAVPTASGSEIECLEINVHLATWNTTVWHYLEEKMAAMRVWSISLTVTLKAACQHYCAWSLNLEHGHAKQF